MGRLYQNSLNFVNDWKEYSNENIKEKKLSIIIPVYHPQHLDYVLNHLSQLNGIYEVILVFDGPDDKCEKLIKEYNFNITIIRHDKNYNAPAANNTGATFASGDILLFLDQDMVLSPSFIPIMQKLMCANDYHSVVLGFRDTIEFEEVPNLENWQEADYRKDWRVKTFTNENLLDLTISNCGRVDNNCIANQEISIFTMTNKYRTFGTKPESTIGYWDLPCMVVGHTLSIPKNDFFSIGGFPEWVIGWGIEDIALGYLSTAHHIPIIPAEIGSYQIRHDPLSGSEEQKWKEMRKNLEKYKVWVKQLEEFPIIDTDKCFSRSKVLYKNKR